MSEREIDGLPETLDRDLTRRDALKALAGGGLALGTGKAADNVLLGYGVLVGTNLIEQDLAKYVDERFGPSPATFQVSGLEVELRDGEIAVREESETVATLSVANADVGRAGDLDSEFDLAGDPLSELVADLGAIAAGDYRFEFSQYPEFFERVRGGDHRPFGVGALRGSRFREVDPTTVERFAGVDPADSEELVTGIASGFREYSGYDTPQYVAGSIQDNVLFDAVNLRKYFYSPTDFEAILSGRNSGLFCYHFAYRSIEAFHAVAPHRQSVPVVGAVVTDARHKHVYTGLATLVREDGDLVVPMTFVDYMHATLYDDFNLRGLLGQGIKAYDRRHRTDDVYWNRYARW